MSTFFRKTKNTLGLDISDVSLKLVELAPVEGGYQVQAFTDAPIPKEVVSGDMIKNQGLLVKTIKDALAHPKFGKITTPYVVASIPETKSFVRVIQMPAMSEDEAAEAIRWEAESYIPLPIGQVYLDWMILPHAQTKTTDPEKMTVLITASPKDYIDDFTKILQEAGLHPLALEVEAEAIARSLVTSGDETVLIMDIDTVRSSLIVYEKTALQFTSSIPIAGNVFTESIARAMGVPSTEAEQIKRTFGLEGSAENHVASKSLLPVLNNLVTEIKNTIRFYEEHSGADTRISRLLLAGSSSKLKLLPSFLQDKLNHAEKTDHPLRSVPGIRVELGDPWTKVLPKKQISPLSREDSLSYTTAIGLALRDSDEVE